MSGKLLWVLAFVLTLGVLAYQRVTGPTRPARASYRVADTDADARLVRSGTTDEAAVVSLPAPPSPWTGTLVWKRYPTEDPYAEIAMAVENGHLVGRLPIQPPAGKVTYFVRLEGPEGATRVPENAQDDPILRYKDPVPAPVWITHIVAMFVGLLLAFRAGFGALFGRPEAVRLAWLTLATLGVGGLVLGPILQKYAFGAFWTGWPLGGDLTDNKLLAAWLAWLAACLVAWWRRAGLGRVAVVLAAAVTLAVFLIPHSARGSELQYDKLKEGVDPANAIKTG